MAAKSPLPPQSEMVARHMTPHAATIDASRTLADAHELMRKRRVRHLPVLAAGRLVGILSLGDLHLLETLEDVDREKVTVDEAMTARPYVVSPETPVRNVVRRMAAHKWSSAVVAKGGRVVGLFTTHDALHLLARVLRKEPAAVRHSGRVSAPALRTTRARGSRRG